MLGGSLRDLNTPIEMMGYFSQKRNQSEPITIKFLQIWIEFSEYVITQQEESQHQPAHLMYFISNTLCMAVPICMSAATFINLTYFL